MFETEEHKREMRQWSRFAVQLNGAADTGNFGHVTVEVVVRELQQGDVFEFLTRELPATVWQISKLTDVDRHTLSKHWKTMAEAYEPAQFHVTRNGLSLLVAYLLHLIDIYHFTIPT